MRMSPAPMSARHVILTIEEGDQHCEREGEITSIWLEWPALRHQISRDTLCLHTTGELDIADQTADPVERAREVTRLMRYPNTVDKSFLTFMYANTVNAPVIATPHRGTPFAEVRRKTPGACLS